MPVQYRIILTGETWPGFDPDNAQQLLAQHLDVTPEQFHALLSGESQELPAALSAEQVIDLVEPLESIGVRYRVSKSVVEAPPKPAAAPASARAAGMMNCPACGHEQMVARQCEACGVVFEDYHKSSPPQLFRSGHRAEDLRRPPKLEELSRAPGLDELQEDAPSEEDDLALFFGHAGDHYLRYHRRTRFGPRNRFNLGWNWGAVFSPFLWSLHRKLWLWSILICVAEVLIPVLAFTLASRESVSDQVAWVGYAALLGNRLFWPLIVDYLYVRHARAVVARLHSMSPIRASEIDIATAGGTGRTPVFAGICFSLVAGLLVWSVVDSLLPEQLEFQGGVSEQTPGGATAPATNRSPQEMARETRRRFGRISTAVEAWRELHPQPGALARLTMTRLRSEMGLPDATVQDAWGSEIQILPEGSGYKLISAGPDRLYATNDDVVLSKSL